MARGLRSKLDAIRSSYWFLPMLTTLGAGVAAILFVGLDYAFAHHIPWSPISDAEGARTVLSVIASSIITVTGVVFSVTVVALTLASSQFGPRLLRNFLRDRVNQFTFGMFTGTFLYSLLVLHAVREDDIPVVASAMAVLLVVFCIFVLIYFIHHTAQSIQASTVIASVAREIHLQLDDLFPEQLGEASPADAPPDEEAFRRRIAEDRADIQAAKDGFVRIVEQDELLRLADEHDIQLELLHRPGEFVFADTSLLYIAPSSAVSDELAAALRACVVLGSHRTAVQDIHFLTGQLTEIAVRALSPGLNDPRTAADCTWRLAAVIHAVSSREMPARVRCNQAGIVRVLAPARDYSDLVDECLNPLREYGAGHDTVVLAALQSIGRACDACEVADRRRLLVDHLRQLYEAWSRACPAEDRDASAVTTCYHATMKQLRQPS